MEKKKRGQTPFYEKVTRRYPDKMQHAHFHDKHELYYLERGKTKYFIGNEIFLLEAGDIIFVPKNVFHKTDSSENAFVERILFTFDDDILDDSAHKRLELIHQQKLIRVPSDKQHRVQQIMRMIAEEEAQKQTEYAEMQRLYFHQLLILLSRHLQTEQQAQLDPTQQWVQNIAKYISEHPGDDLSLPCLSLRFGMSSSHLSRTFRAVTGVGLNEYINVSRVTHAERLLTHGTLSVTEIAERCGFNDSNYFAAVFKKIKGITPKKYALLQQKD